MSNSMYSRPPPVGDRYGTSDCQSLRVHNYPEDFNENDLLSYFSTAVSISCQSNGSSPYCLIQFQSEADCQAAFNECREGKLVGGQRVNAQIVSSGRSDRASSGNRFPPSDNFRTRRSNYRGSGCGPSPSREHGSSYVSQSSDSTLTLRNLAWSVTEEDLMKEFPRAISASIKLDERNRSRGWGTLTFANSSDCRNAEAECSNKSINGRPVRAEIGNTSERYRSDDNFRGGRGGGRPYHERFNGSGGGGGRRGGGFGDNMAQRRRFDDVDGGGSGLDRRSWGGSGGGGSGGNFGGQRRGRGGESGSGFDRNPRDRSPGRRRPPGGGGSGGPRITSAVIRRAPGDSSDSDFDNRG